MFRISFSGEIAYEVNVPWGYGAALVGSALWAAGQPLAITPYGTESMHVLRAEKGYIIVGQDTDGTVTPFDLGMDWIVGKAKQDFIGKRGLARAGIQARRPQAAGRPADRGPARGAGGGGADRGDAERRARHLCR